MVQPNEFLMYLSGANTCFKCLSSVNILGAYQFQLLYLMHLVGFSQFFTVSHTAKFKECP